MDTQPIAHIADGRIDDAVNLLSCMQGVPLQSDSTLPPIPQQRLRPL
jgi:hypothetical protein